MCENVCKKVLAPAAVSRRYSRIACPISPDAGPCSSVKYCNVGNGNNCSVQKTFGQKQLKRLECKYEEEDNPDNPYYGLRCRPTNVVSWKFDYLKNKDYRSPTMWISLGTNVAENGISGVAFLSLSHNVRLLGRGPRMSAVLSTYRDHFHRQTLVIIDALDYCHTDCT
ncbi:hypothetical protein J6590_030808 [Homalodisca vitripennis]|nr:hypothetical protein J6590_030808 [Homalodisca vitripennis]